jgi:hypothetical protein
MTTALRLLDPVASGERIFLPLVRDTLVSFEQGAVVSVNPVALLFFEAGRWMFVPLDEGIGPDILGTLS